VGIPDLFRMDTPALTSFPPDQDAGSVFHRTVRKLLPLPVSVGSVIACGVRMISKPSLGILRAHFQGFGIAFR
jgi:hypothetical protein